MCSPTMRNQLAEKRALQTKIYANNLFESLEFNIEVFIRKQETNKKANLMLINTKSYFDKQ